MQKRVLHFALVLLALASICGDLRWFESYEVILGSDLRFAHINDINWDQQTGTIARTGGDPHFRFKLPASALPITHVTFEFAGATFDGEGTYYILESVDDGKGARVDRGLTGEIERTPGAFRVSAELENSNGLRLDLPDNLPREVTLRRVVLRTPFIAWRSGSFLAAVGFLSLATAGFVAELLRRFSPFRSLNHLLNSFEHRGAPIGVGTEPDRAGVPALESFGPFPIDSNSSAVQTVQLPVMAFSRFRLPLAFLVLAILSGVVRRSVSVNQIPMELVRFSNVHDIAWDGTAGTMRKTGGDPYVVFNLPASVLPVRRVAFIFQGSYSEAEGTFYIFQSPAALKVGESAEVMTGKVTRTSDGFVISTDLRDSTSLRLDLPDFLPQPIELRRMVVTTPFVNWGSWSFRVMLISFVVAIGMLVRVTRASRAGPMAQ